MYLSTFIDTVINELSLISANNLLNFDKQNMPTAFLDFQILYTQKKSCLLLYI